MAVISWQGWKRYSVSTGLALLCHAIVAATAISAEKYPQEYHLLIGTWVRADGSNTLVIEHIDRDGQVLASYIRASEIIEPHSYISLKSGDMELIVDLRRLGRMGRTYKLRYDKESDQLIGIYHHQVFRQDYQIYFVRQ